MRGMQTPSLERRGFLRGAAVAIAGSAVATGPLRAFALGAARHRLAPLFGISLAQWSLHRTLRNGDLDHLDFPSKAKSFGIDAVEYVNQFFKDKATDGKYIAELKKRCSDAGVQSLLIMCDGEGALGDPDEARRARAVDNHRKWVVAARELGCHSIRVNAQSRGSYEEQQKLAADGLRRLCEFADAHGISVLVENHGGLSSNGRWLSEVLRLVEHPRAGALPDFGNFHLGGGEHYDRYLGVDELMPFARGVSAKSHDFDENGNEVHTDYGRMLEIVVGKHGWRGHIGIEFEGRGDEDEGIRKTKALLERVRDELTAKLAEEKKERSSK